GKLHGSNTGYYADGSIRHRFQFREGAKTGINISYFPNGVEHIKEQVSLNGVSTTIDEFNEEGHRVSTKEFKKEKPDGTWTYYAEDGKTIKLKETYENGKLHGLRTTYYPSGKKALEEMYQFNLITGPVKSYYETGKVQWECDYRASRQHGQYTSYYPNGQIKEQGEYVANKKHKEWKEYDEQGNVTKILNFKAGILMEEK
ncbi:MAG TPA: toxin-antitoxin system YwqK family antitoxin, partial [Cyclobacteriaceae bacterium]|nr:toxin-antitoxin system YwqK family antitoxin [Cyclobacteriaceae bacterium]